MHIRLIKKKRIIIIALAPLLVGAVYFPIDKLYAVSIEQLKEQIKLNQSRTYELQDKIQELQNSIDARRSQSVSLSNQINVFNSRIARIEAEIELTNTRIEQTNLEIEKTQMEISQTEEMISSKKLNLSALIRSLDRLGRKDGVEILLLNDTVSDFFNDIESTLRLQGKIKKTIENLAEQRKELALKKKVFEDKKKSLTSLKEIFISDQERIREQTAVRAALLAETKNSEARFQDQLRKTKAEQIRINTDIQNLERTVRQRLESLSIGDGFKRVAGASSLRWPVPFKKITTYFHDPDYPYRYIFEHPALDLRAGQGTPVRAAAPGFVARAADRGTGYSYVMIIHSNGLSTVYGHVSKIMVQEDQFVNQGDIVALSGGTPGTPGAGKLTSGPHLHFETRLNGIPVDPLGYLTIPRQ